MAHKRLRQEKNCLNCGTVVTDRFCGHCGQENLEINDSAFHLVIHYVQDLFHYDGRLWHTLKNFIRRPGLVPKEYMEGKRRQNLEPIRFYVFASTVFFLVLYFVVGSVTESISLNPAAGNANAYKRMYELGREKEAVAGTADTVHVNALMSSLRAEMILQDSMTRDTESHDVELELFDADTTGSAQAGRVTRWISKRISRKGEEWRDLYRGDPDKAIAAFLDDLLHALPKLLFFSLPFFALLLKLLYWRSFRKLYVDHFIFSVYFYAYMFTLFTGFLLLNSLLREVETEWVTTAWSFVVFGGVVYPFMYLLLALKRFYADRWMPLFLRYGIFLFVFSVIILILFTGTAIMALLW